MLLCATALDAADLADFDVYFGDLHNHAAYSESEHIDLPGDAYEQARDNGRVQIYGISEHSYPRTFLEPDGMPSTGDIPSDSEITPFGPGERTDPGVHPDDNLDQYGTGLLPQANASYAPGEFVTFYGIEATTRSSEHLSVFMSNNVFFPQDIDNLWKDFLEQLQGERSDSSNPWAGTVFAQVNHPNKFSSPSGSHPDSERSRFSLLPFSERDQGAGVERRWDLPAGGQPPVLACAEARDGYPTLDEDPTAVSGEFEEYLNALDAGFRLCVDGSHDTHQKEATHREHGAQRWKPYSPIQPGDSVNDQFTGYAVPDSDATAPLRDRGVFVRADADLTREKVASAILAGRTFVTEDADANLRLLFEARSGGASVPMGGVLPVVSGSRASFRVQIVNRLEPARMAPANAGGPNAQRLTLYSNHPSGESRVLCLGVGGLLADQDPDPLVYRLDVEFGVKNGLCVPLAQNPDATVPVEIGQYFVLTVHTEDVIPLDPPWDSTVTVPQPQRTVASAITTGSGVSAPDWGLGWSLVFSALACAALAWRVLGAAPGLENGPPKHVDKIPPSSL